MHAWLTVVAVAVAALSLVGVVDAAPRNVALHRPYVLSPQPNYAPTRNDGDATDLTDAIHVASSPDAQLWEDPRAVGWSRPNQPIVITLDLGQGQAIRGTAVHTAFGRAGVSVPRSIALLVSDDGEHFHLVGDLIRLSTAPMPPAYGTYARHVYRTDALQTRGRFVRFVVVPSGRFFFCDEIEVFAAERAVESVPAGPRVEMSQIIDPGRLTQLGAYARIRTDLETVEAMDERFAGDIADLRAELASREELVAHDGDFRAIVPLNDLHRRVFALHGRALARSGAAPLTVWHSPPYQILDPFVRPGATLHRLSLDLMLNERRAEVFNLTNAGSQPARASFRVDDLPGDVRVYEVQSVDTREGKVCASALLPLETTQGGYETIVEAGMTRQIWLAMEPRDVAPGQHVGRIRIQAGDLRHDVRFELNIAPLRLPDRTRLAFSGWDYIIDKSYSITERNQQAARRFVLDDGLVNGVECGPRHTPLPGAEAFDDEGNLIGVIDFSRWDAFVSFWPGMSHYQAYPNFNPTSTFGGKKIGTPEFARAVSQWASAWAAHNRTLGLQPGQVIVLFIDEPRGDEWLAASYHFAHAFRQGTRDILTFTDPHIDSIHSEWGRRHIEAYDIVCPHLPAFVTQDEPTQQAYADIAKNGRQLWFYSCSGPVRMFDPSYYRFQPWHAYRHGATGSAFWAFGDAAGAMSWNEYPSFGRESFTPLYIGATAIHTSKHFEATREGVMDYEYLRMLEDRVAALRGSAQHRRNLQRAEQLLQSLPASLIRDVESRFGRRADDDWHNASALAEEARKQVLALLTELQR